MGLLFMTVLGRSRLIGGPLGRVAAVRYPAAGGRERGTGERQSVELVGPKAFYVGQRPVFWPIHVVWRPVCSRF